MNVQGLRNLRPDWAPRRKRGLISRILRLTRAWMSVLPACLLILLGFLGGCGTSPDSLLPAIDPLASLPDNTQSKLLGSNSVFPASGPVGTLIEIRGQGEVFPKGFAKFTFHGNGSAEVELTQATGVIRVNVPPGTQSGTFGFTIAGRSSGRDTSAIRPSDTNTFQAYTIDAPGFTVTPPQVLFGTQLDPTGAGLSGPGRQDISATGQN